MTVLDFGVGTGLVLSALETSRLDLDFFAVDVAAAMVELARDKCPGAEIRQITTSKDIVDLGWPRFDLILDVWSRRLMVRV